MFLVVEREATGDRGAGLKMVTPATARVQVFHEGAAKHWTRSIVPNSIRTAWTARKNRSAGNARLSARPSTTATSTAGSATTYCHSTADTHNPATPCAASTTSPVGRA